MIMKVQKWILWSIFSLLVLSSAFGVFFAFCMFNMAPMALNDSSPNFGQLADADREYVFHEAQHLILPVAFMISGLSVAWAIFSGFIIWHLGKKNPKLNKVSN